MEVFPDCATLACHPGAPDRAGEGQATGAPTSGLFVRHWMPGAMARASHLFTAQLGPGGRGRGAH